MKFRKVLNRIQKRKNRMSQCKSVASKSFCKVCFDASKDASEYSSHNVKARVCGKMVVCCPVLLRQECRSCGKRGHTKSYCPNVVEEKKNVRKLHARAEYERTKSVGKRIVKNKSRYEALKEVDESMWLIRPTLVLAGAKTYASMLVSKVVSKRWSEMEDSEDDM